MGVFADDNAIIFFFVIWLASRVSEKKIFGSKSAFRKKIIWQ